nr:hypothetical protein [Streptomyces sabulosicollis]
MPAQFVECAVDVAGQEFVAASAFGQWPGPEAVVGGGVVESNARAAGVFGRRVLSDKPLSDSEPQLRVVFLPTREESDPPVLTGCLCNLLAMALRPDEFYDHALTAADAERRLPLARMTGWDISPFEPDGLRVAPLRPPVLPEPPRRGEDPSNCEACRDRGDGMWFSDRWRLTRITGVGVPLVLMLHPREHLDGDADAGAMPEFASDDIRQRCRDPYRRTPA